MFRVRWSVTARNGLAALWVQAGPGLRPAITAAAARVDQLLQSDPTGQSESRPRGRRILFAAPLGVIFRIEAEGRTVPVLSVWRFNQRGS